MNGSSLPPRLKLVSSNSSSLNLELADNSLSGGHELVRNARNTFKSIGDGFSDVSALALYDAKALYDTPEFTKNFLRHLDDEMPNNFYTNIAGEPALLETLALFGQEKEIYYSKPENIVITSGAVNAFYALCQSLCDKGDVILALSPSYILFANAVKSFGAEMVLAPSVKGEHKFLIDLKALEIQIKSIIASGKKIKAVLVVNPTNIDSQCWTNENIENLIPVLGKYNFPIIEDRVYDGLQYNPPEDAAFFATHTVFASRTITIDSVSKRYGATQWRIGWIYGPEKLIERARDAVMQTVWSPNAKYQLATALLILSGMSKKNIEKADKIPELAKLSAMANKLHKEHGQYFSALHKNYISRRDLSLFLIHGAENYKKLPWKSLTHETTLKAKYPDILKSCDNLQAGIQGFTAPILPQAGMFLLIQANSEVFAKLSHYQFPDLIFARLLYKEARVVMLPSTELTLPLEERMFRIEFGIDLEILAQTFNALDSFTGKFLKMSDENITELIREHFFDREEICETMENTTMMRKI